MMKRLVLLALVASVLVAIPTGAASARADKTDVCHLNDLGEWQVNNVASRAVDAHIAHGDALPGDAVPGMPTYSFDEGCVPQASETIFAVAYTDMNEFDGDYNPDVDVLISKLVDGNGDGVLNAGDLVITDQYPTNVLGIPFGSFRVTQATISSIGQTSSTVCTVGTATSTQYGWGESFLMERYVEIDDGTSIFSAFIDVLKEDHRTLRDQVFLDSGSPSQPESSGHDQRESIDDDTFFDVDLNCTS